MSTLSSISHIRVFPLSIPLRKPFAHAAHVRTTADPVIVEIELIDGTCGYGETLARPYVSGETVSTVVSCIRDVFATEMLAFKPSLFPEALERIDLLPGVDDNGESIVAARAAMELALLDVYSKHFKKPISEAVSWLGLPSFGSPGSTGKLRYSGIISGEPRKLKRSTRLMRWYGLRDFKLKVGYDDDIERVQAVAAALGRSLGNSTTLRLDANGAWSIKRAVDTLAALGDIPISCVEQPFPRERDDDLASLKDELPVMVMHDESLLTMNDAERLLHLRVADGFNIRIAKNGGFLPSIRLAHFARRHQIAYQLGCLVGETSILSAVGRHFLENVPGIMFAEGSYGRFLLKGDIVEKPIRFGYGGKIQPLSGFGWGVEVKRELLEQYSVGSVMEIPL